MFRIEEFPGDHCSQRGGDRQPHDDEVLRVVAHGAMEASRRATGEERQVHQVYGRTEHRILCSVVCYDFSVLVVLATNASNDAVAAPRPIPTRVGLDGTE